jgi:signal transduction histidine kinase
MLRPHRIVACGRKPRGYQEADDVMRIGTPTPTSPPLSSSPGSALRGSPSPRSPSATSPSATSGSTADLPDPPRRPSRRHSLALRLLLITVTLVLVAEILVLIPNIARDRRMILREKTLEAYIAALSSTAPAEAAALAQRDELLHAAGIDSIRLRDPRGTTLILTGDPNAQPAKTFDLRKETTIESLWRSMVAILADHDVLVRIIAEDPLKPSIEIEFVMHRAPLTRALRELDAPDAWLTLALVSAVGGFLYLALLILLVRPMRRLTSSITAFRADPEHGVPLDPRAMSMLYDDEISAAGRELAAMQRELRAALWRNSRLTALGTVVAKVSHDVRGALTPALLQADRLGKHADPAVRRAGETLAQAVERAIDLVHRTLDFARDGPPPPQLSLIGVRTLVSDAAESVRGTVAAFELDNFVALDQQVEADRNHLFRVLVNLLRNAAEAGASRVRVRVRAIGHTLAIELADDGPGLPDVVRENMFRPFTSTRRTGGSGLGLAIARDLMLAHGGDIDLIATGPNGTTFRLTLPLTERADREPQAADSA